MLSPNDYDDRSETGKRCATMEEYPSVAATELCQFNQANLRPLGAVNIPAGRATEVTFLSHHYYGRPVGVQ
jgi:hypothetical protein